ncbi:hypothetical protein ROE7235_02094 [Roseibaca ekhonensis]|uniref:Uncharacterized protein n=1 Tax=Roseinatronobacter ekhonensis TaxID=254356 RepID=A0A3B0MFK7_9RHOB|nr:hypothetical protein [Roseibaca ekhonensis]SUZ32338.1 hypothetical protein ROE7235_02094 [Roseibaca ekhonensis]
MQGLEQQDNLRIVDGRGLSNRVLSVAVGTVGLVAMGTAAVAWPVMKSAIAPQQASSIVAAPDIDPTQVSAFVGQTQEQLSSTEMTAPAQAVEPAILADAEILPAPSPEAAEYSVRPEPRALVEDAQIVTTPANVQHYTTAESAQPIPTPSASQSGKRLLNRWSSGEFR